MANTLPPFNFCDYGCIDNRVFTDINRACCVCYDQSGNCECPATWIAPHCAVMTLDVCRGRGGDFEQDPDGFADGLRRAWRYAYVDDSPTAYGAAFSRHYRRKGWDVLVTTIHDYTDWVDVAIAVAPGYGSAEMLAREISDWWGGNIYEVNVYQPNAKNDSWDFLGSVGGVYLTDNPASDTDYLRELCNYE